jgi:hypothetical protein
MQRSIGLNPQRRETMLAAIEKDGWRNQDVLRKLSVVFLHKTTITDEFNR